ncbi:MAG TPA: hypothetical protein VMB25_20885 [Bryobacteraceae bacterium]|nr:hypothetical protein [Bryobacteraceae bacterium]
MIVWCQRARQPALRYFIVALTAFDLLGLGISSAELAVRSSGDELQIAAPRLHFLTGKSLQRLHDGAAVPFDFQLTVAAGSRNNVVARALERFVVSYDVWEEKFSVVRLRDLHKSGSHLSASAAEAWCLDNIFASSSNLPPGQQLRARLEIRAAEQKEPAIMPQDTGISLTALIEVFSRPSRPQQEHWALESAPFRLADLKP